MASPPGVAALSGVAGVTGPTGVTGVAGTVVYTILDKAIQFFQEPVNRKRIQTQCIDPLLHHILDIMFPYIILTCILFSLILLMSFTSIGLLVYQLRNASVATAIIQPTL